MAFVIVAVIFVTGMLIVLLLDILADLLDCEIFGIIGQILEIALVSFMIIMVIGLCILFVYTALKFI